MARVKIGITQNAVFDRLRRTPGLRFIDFFLLSGVVNFVIKTGAHMPISWCHSIESEVIELNGVEVSALICEFGSTTRRKHNLIALVISQGFRSDIWHRLDLLEKTG